jgi:polysaccharide export outer membrane protein
MKTRATPQDNINTVHKDHEPKKSGWLASNISLMLMAISLAAPLQVNAQNGAASSQAVDQANAPRDYALGAGDILRISVYQNPDMNLETRVSENGTISFPLLGTVKLAGMSVPQAEKTITDGLKNGNFIRQPQVSILLVQIRSNQASVLGMVNRPGRYPIEVAGLRLSDLIAIAGGISSSGSDIVTLTGLRKGQVMRQQIDIPALLTSPDPSQNPIIQNGDTVYVDRMPIVYIYGEVQRPGTMRLERGMTVMQALATGGGLTVRGTDKGIKLHRRTSPTGPIEVLEPAMADAVKDGDVIYVRQSLF